MKREVETTSDWENWYWHVGKDWANVLITSSGRQEERQYVGKSVQEVAQNRGIDVWDALFDLVKAGGIEVAPKSMNEEQKREALRTPFVSIDCDAPPTNPAAAASAHPRACGTFPRVLAKYVRDEKVISLEDAVRKMASLPANRLHLSNRGRISPGMVADLVIFDLSKVQDLATFEKPLVQSTGMDYVIISGKPVIDAAKLTNLRPGEVIRLR